MRIEVHPTSLLDLEREVMQRCLEAAAETEAAMAGRYREAVLQNFGQWGMDRPAFWPPLSKSYARKVGRAYATLYVTGDLFNAVRIDPDAATVSVSDSDVPYATVHQFGSARMPARPYFPLNDDGTVPKATLQAVLETARATIHHVLA